MTPDTPGAVPHYGGHIRCALCHATDRANTASTIIREALSAAERGAMDEVVRLLRSAQPDA